MPKKVCDICGAIGTVSVSTVGPSRHGISPPSHDQTLCRSCARAAGIPLRAANEPRTFEEAEPPSWPRIATHLRAYEQVVLEAPEMRESTIRMARDLWHYAQRLGGEMPPEVVAAFRRLGVDEA